MQTEGVIVFEDVYREICRDMPFVVYRCREKSCIIFFDFVYLEDMYGKKNEGWSFDSFCCFLNIVEYALLRIVFVVFYVLK